MDGENEQKKRQKSEKERKKRKRRVTIGTQKSSRNCPEAYRGKFIWLELYRSTTLHDVTSQTTVILTLEMLHCMIFCISLNINRAYRKLFRIKLMLLPEVCIVSYLPFCFRGRKGIK